MKFSTYDFEQMVTLNGAKTNFAYLQKEPSNQHHQKTVRHSGQRIILCVHREIGAITYPLKIFHGPFYINLDFYWGYLS